MNKEREASKWFGHFSRDAEVSESEGRYAIEGFKAGYSAALAFSDSEKRGGDDVERVAVPVYVNLPEDVRQRVFSELGKTGNSFGVHERVREVIGECVWNGLRPWLLEQFAALQAPTVPKEEGVDREA